MKKVYWKNQAFAASLRGWRLQAGLSRRRLAGRLEVSVLTVVCWESGWKRPGIPLVSSLRRELRVEERSFFRACEAGFTRTNKE